VNIREKQGLWKGFERKIQQELPKNTLQDTIKNDLKRIVSEGELHET
jgi:hypothetical protein